MVVDTGAFALILLDDAVARIGLRRSPLVSRMIGVGGQTTRWSALADQVDLGSIRLLDVPVAVGDAPPRQPGFAPDGFLGASVLARYDVDLDVRSGRMTLYQGVPCGDTPPGWLPDSVRMPLSEPIDGAHFISIPVAIDGHVFNALVDSGATLTTVQTMAALDVIVDRDALLRDRAFGERGLGMDRPLVRLHRFNQIAIGGERFADPVIAVGPLPASAGDMLLGSDFLGRRRVWISYASRRLFFTRETAPHW
jgi:predicted aspartyl protease